MMVESLCVWVCVCVCDCIDPIRQNKNIPHKTENADKAHSKERRQRQQHVHTEEKENENEEEEEGDKEHQPTYITKCILKKFI